MGSYSLTHDEHKAAEAAFRGRPADPRWSERALAVYNGIMASTNGRDIVEAAGSGAAEGDPVPTLVGAHR